MNDSILDSIKKLIGGIPEDYHHFDEDVITQINMAFATLHQLGVGPENGFSIEDQSAIWDEFMDPCPVRDMAKTYIQFKVRLAFDPPTIASVMTSFENQIAELEWRMLVACDVEEEKEGS